MISIAILIFAIWGLLKDSSKLWSVLSLLFIGLIFFSEGKRAASGSDVYMVTYEVECPECSVKYTNESGGDNDQDVTRFYRRNVRVKGDEYLQLFANMDYDVSRTVTVRILVNDKIVASKSSSGKGSSALISCRAQEVDGY